MQVSNIIHHEPLGKSDHDLITFDFHCYLDFTKPREHYDFARADYNVMKNHLQRDSWRRKFYEFAIIKDVDELWSSLKTMFFELKALYVPKLTKSVKHSWQEEGSFPINKEVRIAVHEKNKNHRQWMRAENGMNAEIARVQYAKSRNKAKAILRKSKRAYERSIARSQK